MTISLMAISINIDTNNALYLYHQLDDLLRLSPKNEDFHELRQFHRELQEKVIKYIPPRTRKKLLRHKNAS